MKNHQKLVSKLTQDLYKDKNIFSLILYGSVSRHEETINSDIDLLVINNCNYLQKRHESQYDITIEYVEMSLKFLEKFVEENEVPILFALANGTVLFNKIQATEKLINKSKNILKAGPKLNKKWKDESFKNNKRYSLTEIYMDLLDIDNEIEFNYVSSLLITNAIPILLKNNKLWPQTRKKTINYLKNQCYDGYKYIEILLNPIVSLDEKRNAAKNLTEYVLKPYGGILKGDNIIFKYY
jgi:predicted nucleotidyltransferase